MKSSLACKKEGRGDTNAASILAQTIKKQNRPFELSQLFKRWVGASMQVGRKPTRATRVSLRLCYLQISSVQHVVAHDSSILWLQVYTGWG